MEPNEKAIRQFYQMFNDGFKELKKSIDENRKVTIEGAEMLVLKGEKGDKPEKGVDYFTKEEAHEFAEFVVSMAKLPKDGRDGKDGKDAVIDYEKIMAFVSKEVQKIPKPYDGTDGKDGTNGKDGKDAIVNYESIIESVLEKMPRPKDEEVKRYIDEQINILRQHRGRFNGPGPIMRLGEISDVSVNGVQSGQVLSWNGLEWVAVNQSGGGGGTWGSITGTLSSQTDLQTALDTKLQNNLGRSGGTTLIGGTGTTDDLILRTTSGAGTTGSDMIFQGGNNGATEFARFLNNGSLGIGTASPSARLHVITTGQQMRLGYDASQFFTINVSSSGIVTFDGFGTTPSFTFADTVSVPGINIGAFSIDNAGSFSGYSAFAYNGGLSGQILAVNNGGYAYDDNGIALLVQYADTAGNASTSNAPNSNWGDFFIGGGYTLNAGSQPIIGNTTTTDPMRLRVTSDAGVTGADMIFEGGNNGSLEFARFLHNGKFGIGTITPASTLTIGTGQIEVPLGSVGAPSYSFFNDLNTGMWSSTADTLDWSTNGVKTMTLTASGRLGLGSGAGTTAATLNILNSTDNFQIRMGSNATTFTYDMGRSSSTGLFTFYGNQTGAVGYIFSGINGEAMRIDTSRNLVIGTTTASARLQVNTVVTPSTTVIGQYIVNATSGNNAGASIRLGYAAGTGTTVGLSGYYNATVETGMFMGFDTQGTTRMTLTPSGRLGIGTVSPSSLLHIMSTTEQQRVGYDASNYYSTTVGISGAVTFDAVGAGSSFIFSDSVQAPNIGVGGAANTSTGLLVSGTGYTSNLIAATGSLSPTAGTNATLYRIAGTIVEAASGTHNLMSAMFLGITTVTAGVATVNNTASLFIEGAMTATVTGENYAIWSDDGINRFDGEVRMGAALNHDGTTVGFYGVTPVAQSSAYSITNVTTDRAYDANATTLDEVADTLGTLIADLKLTGIIG